MKAVRIGLVGSQFVSSIHLEALRDQVVFYLLLQFEAGVVGAQRNLHDAILQKKKQAATSRRLFEGGGDAYADASHAVSEPENHMPNSVGVAVYRRFGAK